MPCPEGRLHERAATTLPSTGPLWRGVADTRQCSSHDDGSACHRAFLSVPHSLDLCLDRNVDIPSPPSHDAPGHCHLIDDLADMHAHEQLRLTADQCYARMHAQRLTRLRDSDCHVWAAIHSRVCATTAFLQIIRNTCPDRRVAVSD
jgi:hypothetical protein